MPDYWINLSELARMVWQFAIFVLIVGAFCLALDRWRARRKKSDKRGPQ